MKKLCALLLSILLLLSAFGVLAQDYTLDRKLQLQLLNGSGLTATAVISASPNLRMSALDAATNTMMSALLPGAVLDLSYIRSTSISKGQEDLSLNLKRNGNVVANLRYTTDGILESLQSSLLGQQSLVTLRGDGRLAAMLGGKGDTSWPGMERVLYAMHFSDNAWRAKGEAALKPYLDKLNLWLQTYTKVTSQQAGAATLTVNSITVPAQAMKAQIKQMLSEAYQDTQLLGVLREQFSATETLAYLQPGMLPGFHQALDQLPLAGNISILRHFNSQGQLILDEWQLPMAGARGLKQLSYRYALDEKLAEGSTQLVAEYLPKGSSQSTGAVHSLSLKGGRPADAQAGDETYSYTGNYSLQPEKDQGFKVDSQSPVPAISYDFNLYVNAAKEAYNEQTKISTRDYEVTLLLKPQGIEGLSDQSIKLTTQLSSALGDGKATRFTGQLVWQDLSTQGTITADITGSSVAPWVIPSVNTQGAIRLDSLSAQQLASQRSQLQLALSAALAQLARSLLTTTAP